MQWSGTGRGGLALRRARTATRSAPTGAKTSVGGPPAQLRVPRLTSKIALRWQDGQMSHSRRRA